ncbi:MAG: ferrous iron transport protein A [Clostridiales bacterium]|nr:ferrous iron transport protein A [Clostridiales bacterium]
MTLDQGAIGVDYRILTVGGEGVLRRRLLDMGLTPGTKVCIRKVAPLGDPLELTVRGYQLTLRKEDAARMTVALYEEAAPEGGKGMGGRFHGIRTDR